MDDTIYRRDAIDEIEYELEMINSALDSITLDFNARERLRQRRGEAREILNSIQQLPSAQPEDRCSECDAWNKYIHYSSALQERKKGTWVVREDLYGSTEAKCSECGWETLVNEPGNGLHDVSDLHYCPNCGADMRKDGDHHEG